MRRSARVAALVAALVATPALAWGDRAHRAIADIAWTQLTPAAKRGVSELLVAAPALATPACPVGSLEDAATWADCVRARYKARFAATASWHYVDVSICRPFKLPHDPDAHFVVARFLRERAILADRRQSRVDRFEALLWVVHLAGDLHQPLQVGDAGDRGGNEVSVYPQSGRYPLNLHAEWDRVLVDEAISAAPGGVAGFVMAAADPRNPQGRSALPTAWARESWNLARRVAYHEHDRRSGTTAPLDVGGHYQRAALPVVAEQLERAGVRLAMTLNAALE